jgi:NAD-dependent dihydropyrimidine dehydrogenase PreA subunit
MAYVIAEPCIGVKDTACMRICPVDCIQGTDADPMLYIDPNECIDCGACVPECPVSAIFPADEVPAQWRSYIELNAAYFKR